MRHGFAAKAEAHRRIDARQFPITLEDYLLWRSNDSQTFALTAAEAELAGFKWEPIPGWLAHRKDRKLDEPTFKAMASVFRRRMAKKLASHITRREVRA